VIPTARTVAAEVLRRVEEDAAFAAPVLDAELERVVQLDPRDRALATELVYGALRVRPWLEERIARHAPRGTKRLRPLVRAHLLLATYQLFFLERVPAFAAVDAAVAAIGRAGDERLAGFANAVLRKLAKEAERAGGSARREALLASVPAWLKEALRAALGEGGAEQFIAAGLHAPPLALRVEDPSQREAWLERLREVPGEFALGKISPLAIVARDAGRPQSLPGVAERALTVQEEGSQLVALATGARAGERVLDACAGRGQKTAILARAVGSEGSVDAADLHPSKIDRLREELEKLGLRPRRLLAVDWTHGTGDAQGPYDRALVDAPCTGVGTMRRRPDLELRRGESDVQRLAQTQRAILTRVGSLIRPGGRLVYAVCSVLREEGEAVCEAFLEASPDFEPAPFEAEPARALAGDGGVLRLLPHVHGTDGYFLASFRRKTGW
jgi:16S rRNA (cytosine967-C5)-methyltransferase